MDYQNAPDKAPYRIVGRAAHSNAAGRFEPYVREAVSDDWTSAVDPTILRTEVSLETPRKVLTYNKSPDLPFDRSINPYRGCEHGCIYCFARPTHAYLGLSPGLDFESKLIARPDAPAVLEKELRAKSYKPDTIALGTNTDPYQPIEKSHQIMRGLLEVLRAFQHPVGIVTKGSLIERDIDILSEMATSGLVRVGISITTMDATLSRKMEPRAPAPKRRLQMIERLSKAGIDVRVMVAPVIPGLTDHELERILAASHDSGAIAATYIMLRLPREVADLWQDWLHVHVPNRADKVLRRLREMHGDEVYSADWGKRMRGEGVHAEMIGSRFRRACNSIGLAQRLPNLRRDLFKVPPRAGDQLSLF
ncbi:MAG: PA0069 family radical SAM protein [Pseudoruegeria sp.]